jgi:hypothetical protein
MTKRQSSKSICRFWRKGDAGRALASLIVINWGKLADYDAGGD